MGTVNLQSTKYAYVADYISGNISAQTIQPISADTINQNFLLHFEDMPSNLRFKKINGLTLHIYAKVKGRFSCSDLSNSNTDFDVSTVSYTNMPPANLDKISYLIRDGSGVDDPERSLWLDGGRLNSSYSTDILRGQCLWLSDFYLWKQTVPTGGGGYYVKYSELTLNTPLSSDNKPYLEVFYDDDDKGVVATDLRPRLETAINPFVSNIFSWYPTPGSNYTVGTLEQQSAVLTWKVEGETTEHTLSFSGSSTSITIPANTFPAKAKINWKVKLTANSGVEMESIWATFLTSGLTVAAQTQTGGYINPRIAQSFEWSVTPVNNYPDTDPLQASAVFSWKETGDSTVHTVAISGSTQSVTIAAETFPASSGIQWKVAVTGSQGGTFESEWYTLSTTDSLASATPIAPISQIVDGSEAITFRWSESNDSGTTPTGADLQVSTNGGVSWTNLAQITGAGVEYTAAASTFTAGEVSWRVRAYNSDSVAGAWSSPVSFIVYAAPPQPFVSCDGAPFATITWQSSGQEGYEISVDGKRVKSAFGKNKSFVLEQPLADGTHSVSVRIQNVYGLWSEPGTVTFAVTNEPGDAVTLQGAFKLDAALSWTTESAAADFLIYRDGALIGHTDKLSFTDRMVLGSHSYYVLNRLAGGNYSRSNTVSGRLCTQTPMIAPASGGAWLPLKLSDKSMPERVFSWSQSNTLRHFAGAEYPVAEIAPYKNERGVYDAAFLCASSAKPFTDLKGKIVILKTRFEKVMIGALTSLQETDSEFFVAYEFVIERVHWEDFVDDANS